MTRGWWRRNRWGLVLLLPLVAGLFAIDAPYLYEVNVRDQPRQPAPVDATGTARLDDLRAALVSFDPVPPDDPELAANYVTVPGSLRLWRAVVTFAGPDDVLTRCAAALIDQQDRIYPAAALGLLTLNANCDPGRAGTKFYFLLPERAQPQALRFTWPELLPRYIRLPVTT